jgi:hypothetical protein
MNHRFRPKGSLAEPREVEVLPFVFDEASRAEVFEPARPRGLDEVEARDEEAPLASLMELP